MTPAERRGEYVLRTVEERGVRFVRLWFVDAVSYTHLTLPTICSV